MTEQRKQEKAPAPAPAPAPLGSAAASADPAVQQLLAARDIADRNGDEEAAAGFTARLAELGVA